MRTSGRRFMVMSFVAGLALGAVAGFGWAGRDDGQRLGPTGAAAVADLEFLARFDSGADVSSVHAEDIDIVDGAAHPPDNTGRIIRFRLVNAAGESRGLERPIALVRPVRTADCVEWRYHVRLPVQHRGRSRELLINLNDRSRSRERLLLGRNFLEQGYVLDLSLGDPPR